MAELYFQGNQCTSGNTYTVTCDGRYITVTETDSNEEVVDTYTFFRGTAELESDCASGVIILYTNGPVPGEETSTKNNNRYIFYTEGGVVATVPPPNNCETTCDPSDEFEELLGQLTVCLESCCGGLPVGPLAESEFEDGVLDTAYVHTVADAGDSCPDSSDAGSTLTYELEEGTEVGGTVAINAPDGAALFTPTDVSIVLGTYTFRMLCDGNVVGRGTVSITFS